MIERCLDLSKTGGLSKGFILKGQNLLISMTKVICLQSLSISKIFKNCYLEVGNAFFTAFFTLFNQKREKREKQTMGCKRYNKIYKT